MDVSDGSGTLLSAPYEKDEIDGMQGGGEGSVMLQRIEERI